MTFTLVKISLKRIWVGNFIFSLESLQGPFDSLWISFLVFILTSRLVIFSKVICSEALRVGPRVKMRTTSMLVTNFGDSICSLQVWDVGDRFSHCKSHHHSDFTTNKLKLVAFKWKIQQLLWNFRNWNCSLEDRLPHILSVPKSSLNQSKFDKS